MTRYFFSNTGDYLGGFDGDAALATLPAGAVEVQTPPNDGRDRLINGTVVPYVAPVSLNQQLETSFLSLIPKHIGQTYCTGAVIAAIMQAKVAVINANEIDPSGYMARNIVASLSLPFQMATDQQNLLSQFPSSSLTAPGGTNLWPF